MAGSASWTGQSVQAVVMPTRFDGSGEYVSVLARVKDGANYYALVLRDASKVELRRVTAGKTKVLSSAVVTILP